MRVGVHPREGAGAEPVSVRDRESQAHWPDFEAFQSRSARLAPTEASRLIGKERPAPVRGLLSAGSCGHQ